MLILSSGLNQITDPNLFYKVFYIFFIVLEVILCIYFISTWLPLPKKMKEFLRFLIEPMLTPLRFLIRHSIFNTPLADLTPMIAFVVILFLQKFFYVLII